MVEVVDADEVIGTGGVAEVSMMTEIVTDTGLVPGRAHRKGASATGTTGTASHASSTTKPVLVTPEMIEMFVNAKTAPRWSAHLTNRLRLREMYHRRPSHRLPHPLDPCQIEQPLYLKPAA